ncbi:hypothetical protein, partial [Emergencia timonensis]|uniref:hypothetical protein n=1 Tax=Emergencia timonensis TaxID=1776384 RepID=UPI00241F0D88
LKQHFMPSCLVFLKNEGALFYFHAFAVMKWNRFKKLEGTPIGNLGFPSAPALQAEPSLGRRRDSPLHTPLLIHRNCKNAIVYELKAAISLQVCYTE